MRVTMQGIAQYTCVDVSDIVALVLALRSDLREDIKSKLREFGVEDRDTLNDFTDVIQQKVGEG